ncbi:aminopeptidase P family protein [Candidatus Sumerlaeota bacterium]|nr:aminopeptidase P family protein [Candidatus Sumerlaeota bacterium]
MASKIDLAAKSYAARRRLVFNLAGKKEKIGAFAVTSATDVRYLTGMVEGCPLLLLGKDWEMIFTHSMYRGRPPVECPGCEYRVMEKGLWDEMRDLLKRRRVKRVGFQKGNVTFAFHEGMSKGLKGVRLIPMDNIVTDARIVKSGEEIRLLQKATIIAEKAMRGLIKGGASGLIGRTELELAAELEQRMREYGALRQGFPGGLIVASGPNSASCHHVPTQRKIKEGDVLLIDWGAELHEGYRSDTTRTMFIRRAPERLAKIYEIVRAANEAAADKLKPGVTSGAVDLAARGLIDKAGYGKEFCHGLGHGVGFDIHEAPGLARGSKARLRKNMIVTIEPGIYFNGEGGVRLEDMLYITSDGSKNFNSLTKDLKKMILI